MAKHKHKKHSRRSRREHGDSTPKLDRSITAASQSVPTTSSSSNTANESQTSVSASFVAGGDKSRDEHGIVTELAALEYPAIRKDLRKLAITLVSFAVVLAGLAVLAAQTSVVHDLGHGVYGLAK